MPETLASGSTRVFSYQANVTPPKNYRQWEELIHKLASHWVERYGLDEVREWFFEVWNEPNLKAFWTGTQKDYFKLYRITARALKRVDPLLKVGGPATAKNAWIPEFLEFCEKRKVPVDFVSTHHYPTDAFGKAGADTLSQLQHAPPHVMRDDVRTVRGQAKGLPLYYTEWNISSNPRDALHDEPFAATYAAKIILEAQGLVEGYSFWTFSDIFNENYFPSVPFQGGFGLLNLTRNRKTDLPGVRASSSLGHGNSLTCEGHHETVDAWFVRRQTAATMLLTNHAMPRHPIRKQRVNVRLKGARRPRRVYAERIDEQHANPRKLWESMGRPDYLSAAQVEKLKAASQLVKEEQRWQYDNGNVGCTVTVPPHGIAALTFEFA